MQFIDLKSQYAALKERIDQRIHAVLDHGQYIMGPEVAELEQKLAEFAGVEHVISCANGTDALQLALMALDIGPGDAVITSPFTYYATAESIMLVGATPVFADIDDATFNISPDALEQSFASARECFGDKLKAVMAVDIFGLPADLPRIEALCEQHGLLLIDDAAQGFGAAIEGRRLGGFGQITTTSFFPAKPLGCYGDGGAVLTDDRDLADILRSLRVHGKGENKYDNVRVGMNSRLDTIQAAVLLEKLAVFEQELGLREQVAARYRDALPEGLVPQAIPEGYSSSYAQFSVRAADERAVLQEKLKSAGIPTQVYYPVALHLQPALRDQGPGEASLPIAEAVCRDIFSLPMSPYLASEDQETALQVLSQLMS